MATATTLPQPVLVYHRIAQNRRKAVMLVAMTILTLIPFVMGASYLLAQTAMHATGTSGQDSAAYEARMTRIEQDLAPGRRSVFRRAYEPKLAAMRAREASTADLGNEVWAVMALGIVAALGILYWGIASSPTAKILALAGAQPATSSESEARRLLENLAIGAGLPPPRLYVIESPVPNAFAAGASPEQAVVAVTRGALRLFDCREMEGVLAHELSHIGNHDTRLNTMVASVALLLRLPYTLLQAEMRGTDTSIAARRNPLRFLTAIALAPVGLYVFFMAPVVAWVIRAVVSRSREFLADADAAMLTRYPEGLMRALAKIGGASSLVSGVNPAVSHLYIADTAETLGFMALFSGRLLSTHPPISERVEVLMRSNGGVPDAVIEKALEEGKQYVRRVQSMGESITLQALAAKDDFAVLNMNNLMGRVHRVLAREPVPVYELPSERSLVLARVKAGALVVVFDDPGRWRQVNTAEETFGYISRSVKLQAMDMMPTELYDPATRAAAEARLPPLPAAAVTKPAGAKPSNALTTWQMVVVGVVMAMAFGGVLSALVLFGGK